MANLEHVEILKKGVEAWNRWREESPEIDPDLCQASFPGMDLSRANLVRANLSMARLNSSKLVGADLAGADLTKLNLMEADLRGADLRGADLSQAYLRKADLREAKLTGSGPFDAETNRRLLLGSDFGSQTVFAEGLTSARLHKADLSEANLEGTFLGRIRLLQTKLAGANLLGADLSGADLTGSDLRGADLRSAILIGAHLADANVMNVTFNHDTRCRGIRVESSYGSPKFKRFAEDQDFLEELRETRRGKIVYWIWLILADCGRALWPWISWCVFAAVGFGLKFHSLGPEAFRLAELPWSRSTMVYYSVVTFTTLGFGDITCRTTEAAWWVMAEVILGYIMLGGLISILANKVARRS